MSSSTLCGSKAYQIPWQMPFHVQIGTLLLIFVPLAEFPEYNTPPTSWLAELEPISASWAQFLWLGLSPDTRRGYESTRCSYENFCAGMGVKAWPTTVEPLAEWVTFRAHGSPDEDKLSPDTLQSYLSALRSVHVNRRLPTTVFESKFAHRVLKGVRRSTPLHEKSRALR